MRGHKPNDAKLQSAQITKHCPLYAALLLELSRAAGLAQDSRCARVPVPAATEPLWAPACAATWWVVPRNLCRLWPALLDKAGVGQNLWDGRREVVWCNTTGAGSLAQHTFDSFSAAWGRLVLVVGHSPKSRHPQKLLTHPPLPHLGRGEKNLMKVSSAAMQGEGSKRAEVFWWYSKTRTQGCRSKKGKNAGFFTEECLPSRCLLFLTHKSCQLCCQADKMFTQL